MFNNTYLKCILIFLVIILLIALCIYNSNSNSFSSYKNNIVKSTNNNKSDNSFQDTLNNIISNTHTQINKACEEGYCEAFQSFTQNNTNTDTDTDTNTITDIQNVNKGYLTSYTHKEDDIKIQLFYKTNCTYCTQFMPTWVKLINNLPNNATYEEINSENNNKLFNENNITTVPTIILLVNNESKINESNINENKINESNINENNINKNNINKKKIYMGDRSYNDIKKFLQNNGVNLIQRNFEDFNNSSKFSDITDNTDNTDNTNNTDRRKTNPHCPSVSFDKQIDLEEDTYMYQIFNSDGQYGYASGGNKDKVLTPYMAAFSTVDSYLSSLPDNNDNDKNKTKNSYKNLNECALLYADDIINFGLCDEEQLNNILNYQNNIESGNKIYRVDNTDYSTNNKVVSAIKKVCNM